MGGQMKEAQSSAESLPAALTRAATCSTCRVVLDLRLMELCTSSFLGFPQNEALCGNAQGVEKMKWQ